MITKERIEEIKKQLIKEAWEEEDLNPEAVEAYLEDFADEIMKEMEE